MISYSDYPLPVVEDIARLRRRIEASQLPGKRTDHNLLIGTWNIKSLGRIFEAWEENPDSPKRNLRALAYIAEVVRRLDVVAIQEVKRDTSGIHILLNEFLGPNWGLIISDVTAGPGGNTERLAFIYDRRRVQPSGLAGEIVLPPTKEGLPAEQFARTPYLVGFETTTESFSMLTAHIKYGEIPEDRMAEITSLSQYVAKEIHDRSSIGITEENNLIVVGDFNIDKRHDNPLFSAFISTGLMVPPQLWDLKTTYGTEPKFYDQIAWFMGAIDLPFTGRAGVIDFTNAIYKEFSTRQMTYRVSDHFPLWVEFFIDRSTEQMAQKLGLDPAMPDPLDTIPD